jgi:hypothetical protein
MCGWIWTKKLLVNSRKYPYLCSIIKSIKIIQFMATKSEIRNAQKRQHIANLIALSFNGATKKLYLLEGQARRNALKWTNGEIDESTYSQKEATIETKVLALFGGKLDGFFINSDPRGNALKIVDTTVREQKICIATDLGGDGVLAYHF